MREHVHPHIQEQEIQVILDHVDQHSLAHLPELERQPMPEIMLVITPEIS